MQEAAPQVDAGHGEERAALVRVGHLGVRGIDCLLAIGQHERGGGAEAEQPVVGRHEVTALDGSERQRGALVGRAAAVHPREGRYAGVHLRAHGRARLERPVGHEPAELGRRPDAEPHGHDVERVHLRTQLAGALG